MTSFFKVSPRELLIEHELFLLGYQNLRLVGVVQLVLASLTAFACWGTAPDASLAKWYGYMLVLDTTYWLEYLNFKTRAQQSQPDAQTLTQWRLQRRIIQVLSFTGWGSLSFLLVPGQDAHNVLIMTIIAGVMGYSTALNMTGDIVGFMGTIAVLLVILITQMANVFGNKTHLLAGLFVFYWMALSAVMRNTSALVRKSVELQIENAQLARTNANHAQQAEKANRSKSEFLAAASHDLRQPVHALLLLIEALRQQIPSLTSNPLMKSIGEAGRSINGLFNALMELSRLESGTETVHLTRVDVPERMQRLVERLRPQAEQKGLDLRLRVSASLRTCHIQTDGVLLERVVGNLLSNALRYTNTGGVLLTVRKTLHGGVRLEVWDTGLGIAQADQVRIFEPYVQIGNRERDRSKGMGLGLAIVFHATQVLGVTLDLNSIAGRGSCFRVHFPAALCQPKCMSPNDGADTVKPPVRIEALAHRRVLLVDDDPLVRVAMTALLTGWHMDVRAADVGEPSALDVCGEDWAPDCVLCDFRLPGALNGVELLDLALERFPATVGILLTGELTLSEPLQDTSYLLMYKPVDPHALASLLQTMLRQRA